eukprot:TRINITY_DN1852_c0_g1_i8.p1 TRINITY_DN1852_c0_g1~~TRINITY_DN1852_c0_g1_i8.p1  ORF type:complete len:447 (+),score=130.68 TRINITY_DN1852_c0_g1_i8:196-1536(+)
MDPRNPSAPRAQWYGRQSPYLHAHPSYYFPYPSYPPYASFPYFPQPIGPYICYQRPPPSALAVRPLSLAMQGLPNVAAPPASALAETAPRQQTSPTVNAAPTEESKISHRKENGVYKCHKCERTYLSYPALYTHNKLKHPTPQLSSSTKTTNRGRPKKNGKDGEKPPDFEEIFRKGGRSGGPCDCLESFKEAHRVVCEKFEKYKELDTHPTFVELKKLAQDTALPKFAAPKRVNVKESFMAKRKKKCDEVFANYIAFMKERSNIQYCRTVIIFCLLYRECLNHLSDRLEQEKKNLPESVVMQEEGEEYCLRNNAEQMPDVCNDFMGRFLSEWRDAVSAEEMRELTFHFCNWVFFNGYSCSLVQVNAAGENRDAGERSQLESEDVARNMQNNEEEKVPSDNNGGERGNSKETAESVNRRSEHSSKGSQEKESQEQSDKRSPNDSKTL